MSIRVRFAPSPTGNLHIGGARTALFNRTLARRQGGCFLLRIEDTDVDRSTAEYEKVIFRELAWLGITWDEGPQYTLLDGTVAGGGELGPYRQSERNDIYQKYTEQLLAGGMAYRCTCSQERLDSLRASQEANNQKTMYDRQCREQNLGPDCGPHVIRLKVPADGATVVDDLLKGPVSFDNHELDDMILVRTDGTPTYNFVVVVDDAHMKITHVLRGDEHLNNTPKQLLIYTALGLIPPRFGHMPLILSKEGKKMSKRDGATSVAEYRNMGILPEALVNYLTRLGWAHGDMEVFNMDEATQVFGLDGISTSPGKWDLDKLTWINTQWLKRLDPRLIAERLRPFLLEKGLDISNLEKNGFDLTLPVLALRERARTLVEMADAAAFFFLPDHEVPTDPEAVRTFLTPDASTVLAGLADALEKIPTWTEAEIEKITQEYCKAANQKLGKVAQPARVALCGQKVGPGLFQILAGLGKTTSLRRLRAPAKKFLDAS